MVQRHEVDKLRRIFSVGCADIFNNHIRHILHFLAVAPKLVEQLHILMRKRRLHAVDHVVCIVAALTADIHCGESGEGHIGSLRTSSIEGHKARHILAGSIGFEFCFPADPVGTFLGNGSLGHLVAEFDFKFRAAQAGFSRQAGDIKLAFLLFRFFFNKCRRCKNKPERLYGIQLFFNSWYAYMEKQAAATDTLLPRFISARRSSRTVLLILSSIFTSYTCLIVFFRPYCAFVPSQFGS